MRTTKLNALAKAGAVAVVVVWLMSLLAGTAVADISLPADLNANSSSITMQRVREPVAVRAPAVPRPARPPRVATPARKPAPVREAPRLAATQPSRSCSGGEYIRVIHYPQYAHATQSGCASNYSGGAGECASNNAPIGTIVKVTNTDTGASTTCRVAGTGPFVSGRPIDLTQGVFERLAPLSQGTFHVRVSW